MLNFAIYPNFQKPDALSCALEVCRRLHSLGGAVRTDISHRKAFSVLPFVEYGEFMTLAQEADIVIAIGGDGTILRCARQMTGSSAQILGINTGHLGFMAGLETSQLDELGKLFSGKYYHSDRMILEAVLAQDGKETRFHALNDIVVSAMYGKVFSFSVMADNAVVGQYRADGVICSTATGSTAYALSAGGMLIEPELSCIEITLICPHSLFNRPLLLSSQRTVSIRHHAGDEKYICLSADGEQPVQFRAEDSLIIRKSGYSAALITMTDSGFFDSVNQKLMQSIKGFSDK